MAEQSKTELGLDIMNWACSQVALSNDGGHGCFMGDCPHEKQEECDRALLDSYIEERGKGDLKCGSGS